LFLRDDVKIIIVTDIFV